MKRQLALIAIVAVLSAAVGAGGVLLFSKSAAVDPLTMSRLNRLDRDHQQAARRIEALEQQLTEERKATIAAARSTNDHERRLGAIELRFEGDPVADAALAQAAQSMAQQSAAPAPAPRRGGIATYTASAAAMPLPQTYSPPPAATPAASSAPVTSDRGIIDHCRSRWPNDFSMQAWCQKKQVEAKQQLDRGQHQGVTYADFNTIRSECRAKWSGDYAMQQWCEEKQIEARRSIRQ